MCKIIWIILYKYYIIIYIIRSRDTYRFYDILCMYNIETHRGTSFLSPARSALICHGTRFSRSTASLQLRTVPMPFRCITASLDGALWLWLGGPAGPKDGENSGEFTGDVEDWILDLKNWKDLGFLWICLLELFNLYRSLDRWYNWLDKIYWIRLMWFPERIIGCKHHPGWQWIVEGTKIVLLTITHTACYVMPHSKSTGSKRENCQEIEEYFICLKVRCKKKIRTNITIVSYELWCQITSPVNFGPAIFWSPRHA